MTIIVTKTVNGKYPSYQTYSSINDVIIHGFKLSDLTDGTDRRLRVRSFRSNNKYEYKIEILHSR